jgi:hypothetical protein
MARIRTVKPDLHSSVSLSMCSIEARWVFVGLFTLADDDDDGRLRDLPRQIAGDLFPLDEGVSPAMVAEWMDELEGVDCIRRYEIQGNRCIYLPKWKAHQRISKPTASRLPEPPEDSLGSPGLSRDALEFVPRIPAVAYGEVEVEPGSGKGKGNPLSSSNSDARAS